VEDKSGKNSSKKTDVLAWVLISERERVASNLSRLVLCSVMLAGLIFDVC
jgi:hypothetical protein